MYVYIYTYMYIYIYNTHIQMRICSYSSARLLPGFAVSANLRDVSEFRDVVLEDVVFDNHSSVTPYKVKS